MLNYSFYTFIKLKHKTRPLYINGVSVQHLGTTITCSLKTFQVESFMNGIEENFESQHLSCRLIMKAELLKAAFMDLDGISDYLDFLVHPQAQIFRLGSEGMAGEVQIDYPKSDDVVESFRCEELIKCR